MMMCDQMVMMMELCRMIVLMVPGTQFEYVAQCWEHEQNQLQEHLLGCRHSKDQWQNEYELNCDEFNDQYDSNRCCHQLFFNIFF